MRLKFTALQTKTSLLALNFRNPRISEKAHLIIIFVFWIEYHRFAKFNSIQLHFICIALNHRYMLEGLKMPYMHDTP